MSETRSHHEAAELFRFVIRQFKAVANTHGLQLRVVRSLGLVDPSSARTERAFTKGHLAHAPFIIETTLAIPTCSISFGPICSPTDPKQLKCSVSGEDVLNYATVNLRDNLEFTARLISCFKPDFEAAAVQSAGTPSADRPATIIRHSFYLRSSRPE